MQKKPEYASLAGGKAVAHRLPNTDTTTFVIRIDHAGYAYDPADKHGLHHLAEHIFFSPSFVAALAELNINHEGMTMKQHMIFSFHIPAEHFKKTLKIIGERIRELHVQKNDIVIEREWSAMDAELRMHARDPHAFISDMYQQKAWKGSLSTSALKQSSLSSFMSEDLKRIFRDIFSRQNCKFIFTGKIPSAGTLLAAIETSLSLPKGKKSVLSPSQYKPRKLFLHSAWTEDFLLFTFPTVSEQKKEKYISRAIRSIFGPEPSSRIYATLRNGNRALSYDMECDQYEFRDMGFIQLSLATRPCDAAAAKKATLRTINQLHNEGITKKEWQHAISQFKQSLRYIEKNQYDLAQFYVDEGWYTFPAVTTSLIDRYVETFPFVRATALAKKIFNPNTIGILHLQNKSGRPQ